RKEAAFVVPQRDVDEQGPAAEFRRGRGDLLVGPFLELLALLLLLLVRWFAGVGLRRLFAREEHHFGGVFVAFGRFEGHLSVLAFGQKVAVDERAIEER